MAKLKFTLNKLAKNGFKFTETRENYYTCNLQDNNQLSFHVQDGELIHDAFCHSCKGGNTFFYGINSVIRSFANEIIK